MTRKDRGSMISAVDILCIVIAVVLIAIQAQRGLVLSLTDLLGSIISVFIAGHAYLPVMQYIPAPSWSYLVCLLVPLACVIGLAVFLTLRTKEDLKGWEAAVGSFVGLCTAGVLCYALYQFLVMRYGSSSTLLRNSLLSYQFAEHGVVYEMSKFVRTLMGR
ncbi:MAG TPA: CvpA family protein [Armatimonadota bacterium]|nr:CvpA family protein [Armatimonadota bacterium]